jgi:hypothetical protein
MSAPALLVTRGGALRARAGRPVAAVWVDG